MTSVLDLQNDYSGERHKYAGAQGPRVVFKGLRVNPILEANNVSQAPRVDRFAEEDSRSQVVVEGTQPAPHATRNLNKLSFNFLTPTHLAGC